MTVTQRLTRINPVVIAALPGAARAHASEQGFVLLLPTDVYVPAGASVVALTVLALVLLPPRAFAALFRPVARMAVPRLRGAVMLTSLVSTAFLAGLLWLGLTGPRDPLTNPLPLTVWVVWWIGLVALQGVWGNLWRWIDPWRGVLVLIRAEGWRAPLHLSPRAGSWVAVLLFIGFTSFVLADIAPSDPGRLARIVALYWLAMLLGAVLIGPRWLVAAEPLGVLMRVYARLAPFGRRGRNIALGWPGWQLATRRTPRAGMAVFLLVLLGCGSFDGLNETFWWLAKIGINPLEFPGRSAVVLPTLTGLLAANALLLAAYGAAIALGVTLDRNGPGFALTFRSQAVSILPIALGYHVAHYLPGFLVDAQYALAALSDPFARGDDWLGLQPFYVTTGFFNTQSGVRAIWLAQAGAVVLGHVLGILLAHRIALGHHATPKRAILAQLPLALFMIGYTFFGLWLLASPRGA